MNHTNKLAIELHNNFTPEWELEKTINIVWKLQARCLSDDQVREWFEKIVDEDQTPDAADDVGIVVESYPDDFQRDDWR